MKTNLTLSVPHPCGEKWESFVPSATGGFCGSCQKTVVDFTGMNDVEIAEFFSSKPVHSCGRFRAEQLKRYAPSGVIGITPGVSLFRIGLLSLVLLSFGIVASAQTRNETLKPQTSQRSDKDTGVSKTSDHERIISGKVVSLNDGDPMPAVNVVLKNTEIGMVTDVSGEFTFPKALKGGDVLVFSFIGHETQEYIVTKDIVDNIKISLAEELSKFDDSLVLMGEVETDGIYHHKSRLGSLWAKVTRVF